MKINYEVYEEGVIARDNNLPLGDNPYAEGTDEDYAWYEGWTDMDEAIFRLKGVTGE